jgi:ketosteroid isomerase-like protein
LIERYHRVTVHGMSVEDVEMAERFRAALDAAFATGDRERVYELFADDIEYTTSRRTLRGLHEVREQLEWGGELENLDVEREEGEWHDLGDGHVVREDRVVQRWKETGEIAAIMLVSVDLRIRDGKITRLERRSRPE